MDLETHNTIHHMDSCMLQSPCPSDIILLIKPGLEFYERSNRLAIFPWASMRALTIGELDPTLYRVIFIARYVRIHGRPDGENLQRG